MASVFLADLDGDWINPSQACTNPLFAEPTAAPIEDGAGSTKNANKAAKVSLALEVDDSVQAEAIRPDLIKSAPARAGGNKATVSLNDCLACSGCVTSAETVLIEQQSTAKFFEAVSSGAYAKVVLAMSRPSLAALAEKLGMSVASLLPCLDSFWRRLGVHYVTDASVAADITLLETANEFVARYRGRQGKQQPNSKQAPPWEATETSIAHSSSQRRLVDRPGQPLGDLAGDLARVEFSGGGVSDNAAKTFDVGPLPMLASSCPGWICYAEKTHPAVLPYVSTVKSPQQVMGVLVKQFLGPEIGVAPKDIFHVTVMPCFDKKLEASRLDFFHQDEASDSESPQGFNEVDLVLTSVEVHNLIEQLAEEQDLSPVQFLTSPLNDAHGGDDQGTRRREAGPSQRLPIESLLCSNGERAQEGGGGLPLLRAALSSSSSSPPPPSPSSSPPPSPSPVESAATKKKLNGSGGVAEFVFRYACFELFGVRVPDGSVEWVAGRNEDIHEAALVDPATGKDLLRFATAYGFRNIQSVVTKMRRAAAAAPAASAPAASSLTTKGGAAAGGGGARRVPLRGGQSSAASSYDFVEIMACPSGCLNGGAQIKPSTSESTGERRDRVRRVQAVFDQGLATLREPNESPLVRHLFDRGESPPEEEGKEGAVPLDPRPEATAPAELPPLRLDEGARQRLFHTAYHVVPKMEVVKPGGIKW